MNVEKLRRLDAAILAILPNPPTQEVREVELREARADFLESLAGPQPIPAADVMPRRTELDPGITFRTTVENLLPTAREVGDYTQIIAGRYRGIFGHVHEIDDARAVVRTGDPEEWTAWEAASHRDSCHGATP